MSYWVILRALSLLQTLVISTKGVPLPCSLRWVQAGSHAKVSQNWVPLNLRRNHNNDSMSEYIVRVRLNNSGNQRKFSVASVPSIYSHSKSSFVSVPAELTQNHYAFRENDINVFRSYDVLTNPYDCNVSWEYCNFKDSKLGIMRHKYYAKISDDEEMYVARQPGESDSRGRELDGSTIHGVLKNQILTHDRSSLCLKASKGGTATFSQYFFTTSAEVSDPSQSMLGFDEITNDSPAKVTFTVDHRKRFMESFTYNEKHSWEYLSSWTFAFECAFSVPIPIALNGSSPASVDFTVDISLSKEYITRKGGENETSRSFAKEREVISSRTIEVDPFTRVESCTLSNFQDQLSLDYQAKGRHTAPEGTKVQDMITMLAEAGYDLNSKVEGRSMIVDMNGSFQGSMALRTQFYVTPAGGEATCGQLSRLFRERDRLRDLIKEGDSNSVPNLKDVESKISRIQRLL